METNREGMIIIGKKPTMEYVALCITHLNAGLNEIVLRARGRAISKAVTVTERLKALLKNIKVKGITISSDEITNSNGKKSYASVIEITVERSKRSI
jgi:DNA-binding protein